MCEEIEWETITPITNEIKKLGFYKECGGCQYRLAKVCDAKQTDYCRLFCDGGYTCIPSYEWLQYVHDLSNGRKISWMIPYSNTDKDRCCELFSNEINRLKQG